ncbi:MAG: Ig-like domain-containing protein, partial [Coriobacteriia bacterium]|nr:Ig-like domain-containing protein [Coriobacteriia bacterium]
MKSLKRFSLKVLALTLSMVLMFGTVPLYANDDINDEPSVELLYDTAWVPDPPEVIQEHLLTPAEIAEITEIKPTAALPSSVDLSYSFPTPGRQAHGDCTAWSTVYALKTHQEWRMRGWSLDDERHIFSPAYVYNQLRARPSGAGEATALDLMRDEGVCSLASFPYNDQDYTAQPTPEQRAEAALYKGTEWGTIQGVNAIKTWLASGRGVVAGYANPGGGGHSICLVGYDDSKVAFGSTGAFKYIDSQGPNWAEGGYSWIPYDHLSVRGDIGAHGESIGYVMIDDPYYFAPTITSPLTYSASVGNLFSFGFTATGKQPITWSVVEGSLPLGLTHFSGMLAASGTYSLTVKAENSVGSDTKAISLTVTGIDPTNVAIVPKPANVTAGQRIQLTTTVLPENAPYKTVTWTSSDTSIATVNDLGEVRGVIAGQATITTTTGNGLTDTCVVTVDPPQVTVSPSSLSLSVGSFQSLTAAVLPEFRRVTWSSSDTSIATVSSGGLVSAVSPGQVTITARTADGGSGTCVATVTEIMPERVFISPAPISPILGRSTQLTAQISPANASNKTVTWTSNDPSVATVDNTGNVTAVSIGQTSVTATAVNGISDTITVTVRRPDPTGVTISPKPVSLTLGAKTQLTASVLPETADQAVTWSSYDSSVASVDAFGNVTALRVGQTTIQVQTTNGQRSDSCVVTVSPSQPQPSIAVATTGLTNLKVGQAVNATVTYTASSATFASTITPSHFTVGNLPAGLSAQAAQRASDTRVTITITGTPTTHNANTITLTRSTSIPASNLTGVTSAIAPTGTITASAVAKGNGGALSGAPAEQSKTSNSVTVGALTNTGGTGQSVEYAISTSSTPTPSTGWQNSTTFSGLSPGIYYVHARTAESLNYNAGTARASAAITVVNPAIVVSATGLTNLKVGQAVNASVIYTLSGATYASPITASHFSVGNLPAGLSAGAATRGANGTAVTVPITGTPTTHTTNAVTLTRSTSIPASNITGAISAITPSGTITASAVAKGDGGAISGLPTQQSKTSNSVTVGALTNVGGTGQSVQYAISTSSTSTPSTGWQNSTTFSALSPGTYYVHARTAESANYNAGTARVSAVIYVVNPAITVTTTGLTNLKVGQGVNASVVYTLTGATYAPAINSSHFSVGNLPAGLSAGEAARGANNTTVTIPITGRPTTHATSAVTLTRSTSIAASNVTGATSAITPTGSITASAVVKGDGSLLTAVPSVQSKTASTITVKPLFLTTATGQSIEYAINTSATTTPSSGWKTDTTFSGLAEGTVYYVHARSAANTNYNAGRVLVSTGIETDFVGLVFTPNNRFATANVGAGANGRVPITVRNTANTAINVTVQGTQGSSIAADPVLFNSAGAQIAFHNFYNFNFGYNVTLNAGAMWRGFVGTGGDVARSYTVETTWSAMAVSTTGLSHLKVGQAVSGASMVYTLASGTFVQTITPSHFTAGNLPAGLTAGAAERTNNTTVTIPITGTPTTHSTLTSTPTRAFSIPAANVTDATSSIVPTGVPGASAVAKGDGSPLNNVPTVQNTTANSITVNTLTTTLATGQTVQYAISTSGTVTPVSGWQNGTTFSNLLAGTYYVYARSAENANYYAGPVRVSGAITVGGGPALPAIAVSATGLTNLKVGQAVSGASVVYTLTNGTYATSITPSHFTVTGLPVGLTAGTAQRTSNTVVTIPITGTPTTYNASTTTLTFASSIPVANVTGATSAIVPTGTPTASAIARGDGGAVSGAPTEQSKTSNSITVGAVTNIGGTGQSVEYAISTSATTTPTSGWQ